MKGATAQATGKRTCVGCGRRRRQRELVRFRAGRRELRVHLEGGEGRGAYVCPDVECLERAVKRKAFQRALRAEIGSVSAQELRETIHRSVLQKVQRLVGLARRAKKVVAGSHALQADGVRLLLMSRDIVARAEKRRFWVEVKRRGAAVVTLFSREQLGAPLGGPPRDIVGLLDGGVANGILQAVQYWVP